MWIDATVAASFVTNPKDSTVADKVGFALALDNGMGVRSNWLWAWALAIPAGTQKEAAAKQFIEWATSNSYIELVARMKVGQTFLLVHVHLFTKIQTIKMCLLLR